MKKKLALLIFIAAILAIVGLIYVNYSSRHVTRLFSSYSLLTSSWEMYKKEFISPEGRVIDSTLGDITTSEGQSYALLRAVWLDDKPTFDLVWKWTTENLQRDEDKLFGWKWGKLDDGSWGLLTNGGENVATDADNDIALALIFASRRWGDRSYADQAQPILDDLWKHGTVEVNGKRYFLAGNWANSESEIVLNPSYFAPYAWRIFADFDKTHDWESLIAPAYEVLNQVGQIELNGKQGLGLPPNWIAMDKATSTLQVQEGEDTTRYSFDAMRVPWRIALDAIWFPNDQAQHYLASLSGLSAIYRRDGKLTGIYEHDGTAVTEYESPAMYATAMGYYKLIEPELAAQIFEEKILSLYSNDTYTFKQPLNYYDQNWLWFSAALYYDQLPNLYSGT